MDVEELDPKRLLHKQKVAFVQINSTVSQHTHKNSKKLYIISSHPGLANSCSWRTFGPSLEDGLGQHALIHSQPSAFSQFSSTIHCQFFQFLCHAQPYRNSSALTPAHSWKSSHTLPKRTLPPLSNPRQSEHKQCY